MVKKANAKWRMCTNYTNLNRVCPKDYALPNFDRPLDGAFGFQLLSFLDICSEYNQIRMHPLGEEKTAFITKDTHFCYRVVPFRQKNRMATHQRLMDQVFKQ